MIKAIGDNIFSPLGTTTEANLQALLAGRSCLRTHAQIRTYAKTTTPTPAHPATPTPAHPATPTPAQPTTPPQAQVGISPQSQPATPTPAQTITNDLAEPFVGSLFDEIPSIEGFSCFESLCIHSADKAIAEAMQTTRGTWSASDSDCVFVLSSTKGNIWNSMSESALKIAQYFGNHATPIVVSTACTSGVSAQIVAHRLLTAGQYRSAVVIGCDVQCEFIVSGFQSFKALSSQPCKPFDAARDGLNAGEAAATLILSVDDDFGPETPETPKTPKTPKTFTHTSWILLGGSIHNDANHISGPSRTAEGSLRCLQDMLEYVSPSDLACVSVHGTGTNYNDEMESIAIHRAGLDEVPVSALKGFYGHTMGAAGLMESILTMHAIDNGIILPSRGFDTNGTTFPVNISNQLRTTSQHTFIKLLSGFGGVNAAVAWTRQDSSHTQHILSHPSQALSHTRQDFPHPHPVFSGSTVATHADALGEKTFRILHEVRLSSSDNLVALYREHIGDYPKFFKMDTLSRLGIVAVEMLRKQVEFDQETTAIIMANYSASLQNDTAYQATIQDKDNYYPSPALFVYTLPNIVTGELAIRHHIFGETMFYVLPDEQHLLSLAEMTLAQHRCASAIVGWLECKAKDDYQAHVYYLSQLKN